MSEEPINFELLKYWMLKVSSFIDEIRFEKDEENYREEESFEMITEDVFRWYK